MLCRINMLGGGLRSLSASLVRFKSIFKIFIRFLHHSVLPVIANVLPLSVSLLMTVIGLD